MFTKVPGIFNYIVVGDRLTKYCHVGALDSNFATTKVALLFITMMVKLHGLLKSVVSNRNPIFMSKFWQDLFTLSRTNLHTSSAYHPQSDG